MTAAAPRAPIAPGMCANGCAAPISPPSRVICAGCMDRISANLEAFGQRLDERERERKARRRKAAKGTDR